LRIVLTVYPNADAFKQRVLGLIKGDDVLLLAMDDVEVPAWRHRELLVDGTVMQELDGMKLRITDRGAARVA